MLFRTLALIYTSSKKLSMHNRYRMVASRIPEMKLRILATLLTLTFLTESFALANNASQSIQMQAIADAQRDVEVSPAWILAGLGFSIFGVAYASLATPSVPITRLIGKDPDYIIFYTETYQREVRKKRKIYSAIGCVGNLVLYIIIGLSSVSYYNEHG